MSIAGDLWVLGNHKLLVGDATVQDHVDRLMAGDFADLIFTDPPYNFNYEGYTEERLASPSTRTGAAGQRGCRPPDVCWCTVLWRVFRDRRSI